MTTLLIKNAAQIVSPQANVIRGQKLKELSIHKNTSIMIQNGLIQQVGAFEELKPNIPENTDVIDAKGQVVIPGFVDSHSHLVFGEKRTDEFAERCLGVSYEDIAKKGGGIASTVKAIHDRSKEELKEQALYYLSCALRQGITTMEIKSGYGLSREAELKILEVINELKQNQSIELATTFLGAHAIPKEKSKKDYIAEVIQMMPKAAKLAEFCDVFCEEGYFNATETKIILEAGKKAGMLPKMHVNQFHDIGGIQVGIDINVVSLDHLEVMSDEDIKTLAKTNIACTVLPGVSLFLNIPFAPGRKMIDSGCIPVIATDFNPGSSMTLSMQLLLNLACTQMNLSVEEALCCATQNGAYALKKDNIGCLLPNWQADLLILNTDNYRNIAYFFGENHIDKVIKKGKIVYQS